MQPTETTASLPGSERFTFFHAGAVLSVAVALIGITWMKNPQAFDFLKDKDGRAASALPVPRYYAYVPPAGDSQPMVAGASTEPSGPSIINEDGSITPAIDIGEVLGANTQDLDSLVSAIKVATVPDSEEGGEKYFAFAKQLEAEFLDNAEFEQALTSGSQAEIDKQAAKIKQIKSALEGFGAVPESLARFHKLNIVQYQAAVNLLENFLDADQNPEMATKVLGEFLQAQQMQEQELLKLNKLYNAYAE